MCEMFCRIGWVPILAHVALCLCIDVIYIIASNPSCPFHAGSRDFVMGMVPDGHVLLALVDELADAPLSPAPITTCHAYEEYLASLAGLLLASC